MNSARKIRMKLTRGRSVAASCPTTALVFRENGVSRERLRAIAEWMRFDIFAAHSCARGEGRFARKDICESGYFRMASSCAAAAATRARND